MRVAAQVAQIQISMLGPLALAVDGRPVVVAGRRRRALIARLALDPGRPVSMYRLAEDLWENDDERRSLPTLRTYVAKLRQLIPHGATILVSEPAGYALALDVDSVDAFRFEQLVHGAGGDDRHVERVLTEALSMWRGNALEEFAHLDWARPFASRLDETRLFAYERLFDTQLALGQHAAIVDTLTALVHLHPLRERFHVQLATALYRSGRQADALDTQRRARTLLLHELGIDPGRELAALERQILEHDSVLAPPNATVATTNEVWASPLPVALQPRAHDPPFVGRDDELARIADRVLRLDGAHLVAITGEAGIGKTRLAAEAAEAAVAAGAAVLYGSCEEHLDLPYQPYVEALRDFASRGPLEGLASRLGSDAGALVPLLPALAPYLPIGPAVWASSDPSAEQHRLFEAVLGWFTAMTETQPLVFVIDDLQWAAGVTTLLTGHVLRRLRDRAVLFIATIRTDERGRDDVLGDVMARLHRDRVVDTLALAGLDATAAAQLVAAEGHALTDHAIDELWRATAGNPFLFTETMRSAAMNADTIPSSIRNVLLPRARRLDAPTQELLATASVVGLEFDLDTVAAAAELSEDTSLAALDEAIASGYVVTIDGATSRVAFRHAIAQRTLYEANSVVRRATLHRRVAEVMEARAGDDVTMAEAAELARQWREAGSPHRRAASLWSARAGRLAMQQFAYDAAATHLEQAVALADTADDRERLVLLLDLARAHTRAANAVRGRAVTMRAVELARKVGDPVALAHASLGTAAGGRGVSSWIADDLRVEALAEAYQGLTDDTALRVRVGGELALALYLPEQRHRRQTIAREAVELAQAEGSPAAIAAALAASRVALWRPEHTPRRLDFARTVEAIAVADGDVWLEASALDYLRGDCNELGDRAGFDRAGARIQELAARTGGVLLAWRAGVVATHNALLAGAFADAERLAHEALARWQDDPAPDAVQTFGYHIGLVRIGQGRHAEAVDLVESAVKMWPKALGLYAALASQCAAAGDTERALGLVEDCVADDLALMPQDSGWLISLVFLADAAACLRHEPAMTALTEILTPFADRFAAIAGPDTSMGTVAAVLGALAAGRGDRAAATMWWQRACRLEEDFGDVRSLERSRARLAATR